VPISGLTTTDASPSGSQILKVHGWHRYCAWGPYGYHRHVPGIGRVPCDEGGYHEGQSCRSWRHECADRWGWGNWRYERCLRRHGC
jgi:hypothetical protein